MTNKSVSAVMQNFNGDDEIEQLMHKRLQRNALLLKKARQMAFDFELPYLQRGHHEYTTPVNTFTLPYGYSSECLKQVFAHAAENKLPPPACITRQVNTFNNETLVPGRKYVWQAVKRAAPGMYDDFTCIGTYVNQEVGNDMKQFEFVNTWVFLPRSWVKPYKMFKPWELADGGTFYEVLPAKQEMVEQVYVHRAFQTYAPQVGAQTVHDLMNRYLTSSQNGIPPVSLEEERKPPPSARQKRSPSPNTRAVRSRMTGGARRQLRKSLRRYKKSIRRSMRQLKKSLRQARRARSKRR